MTPIFLFFFVLVVGEPRVLFGPNVTDYIFTIRVTRHPRVFSSGVDRNSPLSLEKPSSFPFLIKQFISLLEPDPGACHPYDPSTLLHSDRYSRLFSGVPGLPSSSLHTTNKTPVYLVVNFQNSFFLVLL